MNVFLVSFVPLLSNSPIRYNTRMRRFIVLVCVLGIFGYASQQNVFAIVNPLDVPNNHFGIHIVDENDLDDAARLVNSNGGEWGYVTMVIRTDDRKREKWQRIFDRMRKLKLIPIIRLATQAENSAWKKPTTEDAQGWADFLNSLNWVVRNRYVVLFNETNHANEWGGEVKPEEYALMFRTYRDRLKTASDDFFILLGGMDEATPTNKTAMEAGEYLRRMVLTDNDIFTLIDGLAVHSYPNPNFSGSPYATGKATIRSYEWLTNYLSQYKLNRDIPIFITETGWTHREGSGDEVVSLFTTAFTSIWTDKRIVAITPFILNYQDALFSHFSWKILGADSFYPQYDAVAKLPKNAGQPEQLYNAVINVDEIPNKLNTDYLYLLPIRVENTGQALWEEKSDIKLNIIASSGSVNTLHMNNLEPMKPTRIKLPLKTPSDAQTIRLAFQLFRGNKEIGETIYRQIEITPSTSIWSKIVRLFRLVVPAMVNATTNEK